MPTGVLHTLAASPSSAAFAECLRMIQPGDALVLLADAVYAHQNEAALPGASLPQDIPVYTLRRDCEARGVSPQGDNIINMADLVTLTENYPRQLAWY